jgi:hypothetical protein
MAGPFWFRLRRVWYGSEAFKQIARLLSDVGEVDAELVEVDDLLACLPCGFLVDWGGAAGCEAQNGDADERPCGIGIS